MTKKQTGPGRRGRKIVKTQNMPDPPHPSPSEPGDSGLRIVGLGASAGGLEALKEFFGAMPADSGMAFVIVQHLDPAHESRMAEILAKCTTMKVVQAEDGMLRWSPTPSTRIPLAGH